jgi:hypothetical protein
MIDIEGSFFVCFCISLIGSVQGCCYRHVFDMVWLYHSPTHGGGGGYFTWSNNFYLPSRRLEKGGGVKSAPCDLRSIIVNRAF